MTVPMNHKPAAKAKTNDDALKLIVGNDPKYPVLAGVLRDVNHDVATNAKILVAVPVAKARKSTQVVNPKTGEVIAAGENYPNWKMVVPWEQGLEPTGTVKLTAEQVNELAGIAAGFDRVKAMNQQYNGLVPMIMNVGGQQIAVDAQLLLPLIDVMERLGSEGLNLTTYGDRRAILVEDGGGKGIRGLIMPMQNVEGDSVSVVMDGEGVRYVKAVPVTKSVTEPEIRPVGRGCRPRCRCFTRRR
jgi:hypothetical protein